MAVDMIDRSLPTDRTDFTSIRLLNEEKLVDFTVTYFALLVL